MANGTNLATYADLQARPLGSQRGESFGMPQNYEIPAARIYVRNHSRTRRWKRLLVAVSAIRGAEDALIADKELAKVYNVDTLVKQVEKGRDMNRYKTEVYPVAVRVRIPGLPDHKGGSFPGRDIVVPPAESEDSEAPAVEVPEGTWDLYLGNYDRMRGIDRMLGDKAVAGDNQIISAERARLGLMWAKRHNPVFLYTDDGQSENIDNPYGILEFVRITQRAVLEPTDRDYLTSLDIIEVA